MQAWAGVLTDWQRPPCLQDLVGLLLAEGMVLQATCCCTPDESGDSYSTVCKRILSRSPTAAQTAQLVSGVRTVC